MASMTKQGPRDLDRINAALTAAPRVFSPANRAKLADSGAAMPDGSFPIPDCGALARAIQSIGRAHPSKVDAIKAHIRSRKAALKCDNPLPASWASSVSNLMKT